MRGNPAALDQELQRQDFQTGVLGVEAFRKRPNISDVRGTLQGRAALLLLRATVLNPPGLQNFAGLGGGEVYKSKCIQTVGANEL